ncbi:uncharacterized protein TNCV_312971 [Trichonephila clavipes]|nr:uncharacterized protein TNCV_312971 [Trichonephila clavipes]
MNKIRKTPAVLDCPIVLSEEFIAIDDDNVCMYSPIMSNKDILEFVQSSKNIIDGDSDGEMARALDSGPEGLGSMPVPPNILRVHTEYVLVKSVGLKVLWAESRVHGTGENFSPRQFHA